MLKSLFQSKVSSAKNLAENKAESSAREIASKSLVKYLAVFVLLFLLPGIFCFFDLFEPSPFFIGLQVYAFFLGIIHVMIMSKKFNWRYDGDIKPRIWTTVFILLFTILLFGVLVFTSGIWGHAKSNGSFFYLFPTAYFFFSLPMLMRSTFDLMYAIPDEEYKQWYYPEKTDMPDLDRVDFSNSYVLTFEIRKNENDRMPTYMKFKAPLNNITFGELFYFYVFEYNEKNRESRIDYLDKNRKPCGWLFYVKPKRWWQSKLYIDPSLTVRENNIAEHGTIVPNRII